MNELEPNKNGRIYFDMEGMFKGMHVADFAHRDGPSETIIIDSVDGIDGVTISAPRGSELRARMIEMMRHTKTRFTLIKERTDRQDAAELAFGSLQAVQFRAPLPPAPRQLRHEETVLEFEER